MQPTKPIVKRIETRVREEHDFEQALRNTSLVRCQSQVCCGPFATRAPAALDLGDRFTRNMRPQLAEIAAIEAEEQREAVRERATSRRRDAKGHYLTG